ncbi:MAG: hypothetical protein JRG85_04525 [Deltaproteobacteria bacterium]|nr:hypothetical protein [Deltaproteobacteria bacterium]
MSEERDERRRQAGREERGRHRFQGNVQHLVGEDVEVHPVSASLGIAVELAGQIAGHQPPREAQVVQHDVQPDPGVERPLRRMGAASSGESAVQEERGDQQLGSVPHGRDHGTVASIPDQQRVQDGEPGDQGEAGAVAAEDPDAEGQHRVDQQEQRLRGVHGCGHTAAVHEVEGGQRGSAEGPARQCVTQLVGQDHEVADQDAEQRDQLGCDREAGADRQGAPALGIDGGFVGVRLERRMPGVVGSLRLRGFLPAKAREDHAAALALGVALEDLAVATARAIHGRGLRPPPSAAQEARLRSGA